MPQASLAEAWGVAQDGTIYNFSIRQDAVWHDGKPVTSDDVIFTVEMMKSAGSLYPQDIKDLWNKVEITRLNDKNLKFTLPEPFVPFMDYLTFGVLPKHLLETVPADQMANAEFNINPVGSGPYKFDHLIVDKGQITGVCSQYPNITDPPFISRSCIDIIQPKMHWTPIDRAMCYR
jgi:peptide/nickel transport system substrate-binding protein